MEEIVVAVLVVIVGITGANVVVEVTIVVITVGVVANMAVALAMVDERGGGTVVVLSSRGSASGCHRSSVTKVVEVVEDVAEAAVVVIIVIVITRLEVGVVVVLIVG